MRPHNVFWIMLCIAINGCGDSGAQKDSGVQKGVTVAKITDLQARQLAEQFVQQRAAQAVGNAAKAYHYEVNERVVRKADGTILVIVWGLPKMPGGSVMVHMSPDGKLIRITEGK